MNQTTERQVVVLGSGGREAAFTHALLQDESVAKVFLLGTNAGFIDEPRVEVVSDLDLGRNESIVEFCIAHGIDLVVNGPEGYAARGVVDALRAAGITTFGATRDATLIESDKAWARQYMAELGFPQPYFEVHDNFEEALIAARRDPRLRVVKASGLAAGKGVTVCNTFTQVEDALRECFIEKKFKDAGEKVVLEERLGWDPISRKSNPTTREVSVMYYTDGQQLFRMPVARDYKRQKDNDEGPNTGGMGSVLDYEALTPDQHHFIQEQMAYPLIEALANDGSPFTGILYVSLMLVEDGIYVIEINARGGDPETIVQLAGQNSEQFAAFLIACALGKAEGAPPPTFDGLHHVVIELCAREYPDGKSVGEKITGLDQKVDPAKAQILHAGTKLDEDDKPVTNGGRVIAVRGSGKTPEEAQQNAYGVAAGILFNGQPSQYRDDIGGKQRIET